MNEGVPTRWLTTRDTLATLLQWLDETQQWVASTAAETAAVAPEAGNAPPLPSEAGGTGPDLYTLLAALTALRQEVKLQTRSARHDREQTAQTLTQLSQAVSQFETLRQSEASRATTAVQETERAAAEALIEVHDALSRAAREAERLVTSATTALQQWSGQLQSRHNGITGAVPVSRALVPLAPPKQWFSWLRGRFRRPLPEASASAPEPPEVGQPLAQETGQLADRLAGLATGYRLSVERLERLLAAYGVTPIACLGQPVDAELMEVVQVVVDPAQPAGIVCDEVRRGYRRHGQVYRFAQVVATRATPAAAPVARHEEP